MSNASAAVGVIGMGHVGPAIASALRATGFPLVGVGARSAASRERADLMVQGIPILSSAEVASKSEILILAVPDREIEPLTEQLVAQGVIRPGQVVIHLSGAQGLSPLAAATRVGALPVALHPAMTFSGTSLDVPALEGLPIAYTSTPVAAPLAAALIQAVGGIPVPVEEGDRVLYHAALTHASNHVLTLIVQAADVLREAGIEEPSEVMGPLVRAACERALGEGAAGLTGPVARGDNSTVAAHLEALSAHPDLQPVARTYDQLTQATRAVATQSHLGEGQPALITTRSELLETLARARAKGPVSVGLVMTMGALHAGHLSLVSQLAKDHDAVLVTIFVNPTQFGPDEDFDKYPRDLEADMSALAEVGATWVYAPASSEVYRGQTQVHIEPGPAGRVLEGALRPGHFAGVLQVVGKVMNLVRPTSAIFGQKDAQQFVNIRQMVHDLDIELDLVQGPIHREADGLALSSRNTYLDSTQRALAPSLYSALQGGAAAAQQGRSAETVVAETANQLLAPDLAQQLTLQYVALADLDSFEIMALWAPTKEDAAILAGRPLSSIGEGWEESDRSLPAGAVWGAGAYLPADRDASERGTARVRAAENADDARQEIPPREAYLLVAAKVGETRLIDNVKVQVLPGE